MARTGEKTADNKNKKNARLIALEIVYQVIEKGAFANLTLEKYLSEDLTLENRRFVTEIVNGTIRMKLYLDWVLSLFVNRRFDKINPWLRDILRISVYQIIFMDRIPDHAVVSEAVNLTRLKASNGLSGFCNAVLRNLIREKETLEKRKSSILGKTKRLSITYSIEEWIIDELCALLPESYLLVVLDYFNQPGKLELRTNLLKGSTEELANLLKSEGIETEFCSVPTALRIVGHFGNFSNSKLFMDGKFYIQNQASQLAAYIASPSENALIFDLCCGIGGKSTHLAEYTADKCQIISVDIYAHKLALLLSNAKRLGIHSIKPQNADIENGLNENLKNSADVVLLDVPCSGWGVFNRRTDLRWRTSKKELSTLEIIQKKLINKASELVKPGGVLVYSTCTIRIAENEMQILRFIHDNPSFILEGFSEKISFFPLNESDKSCAEKGMLTILPGVYGTDGMFYARLRKRERQ